MIDHLLSRGLFREFPGNRSWMTLPDYLDEDSQFLDEYKEEYEKKLDVYNRWTSQSPGIGYYAEQIFKEAFIDAGYSASKVRFECPPTPPETSTSEVEIDLFCVKPKWHLGVQIKNVTSDVFIDPDKIGRPTKIYRVLKRQFEFCSSNGIIPILIAPFIDGSFYCFDDTHKGLHCQTFLQLFKPEHRALCMEIKKILGFGNIRPVEKIPPHTRNWVERIPETWRRRHGIIVERPR